MKYKFLKAIQAFFIKKEEDNVSAETEDNSSANKENGPVLSVGTQISDAKNKCTAEYSFTRLAVKADRYYITSKRKFNPIYPPLKAAIVEKVFDFAYSMSYGGDGRYRNHRSGGTQMRGNKRELYRCLSGEIGRMCSL